MNWYKTSQATEDMWNVLNRRKRTPNEEKRRKKHQKIIQREKEAKNRIEKIYDIKRDIIKQERRVQYWNNLYKTYKHEWYRANLEKATSELTHYQNKLNYIEQTLKEYYNI